MTTLERQSRAAGKIKFWLGCVALLVFALIVVGGATRLTDSGLSITEWLPILGVWPPLNDVEWQAAFDKYKLSSEFKLQNSSMTIAEFKPIYWWEWGHRLLGRAVGVAFALPFAGFLLARRIGLKLFLRLLIILALGAAQGALGWYMVASGLVNRTDVSQYRLAAHLTLAAIIFAAILWTAWGLNRDRERPRGFDGWTALLIVALVLVQIASGGFVAGLDAGLVHIDWPMMDGQWIPSGLLQLEPLWRNAFENLMTVQFNHRMLAYLLTLVVIVHAWRTLSLASLALLYVILIQIALGVLTLWSGVYIALALAHQAAAMLVLFAAVWNLHKRVTVAPLPGEFNR